MHINAASRTILLILLFAAVIASQLGYDRVKPILPTGSPSYVSPQMIRLVDLGFHSAVASGFWVSTMPELLALFRGDLGYLKDRACVNQIDPKLTYPYAFSVLTLPIVAPFPRRIEESIAIGKEGLAKGDPDWRIPYYMAINYYLALKDLKNATWYFNVAANTPGVPQYAARFALNFGINQRDRDRVRNLWKTVYESSNDPATKERAAGYVERLNIFDYLEAAAKVYRQKYGAYPSAPNDLVVKKIIPEVPQDPFGFVFIINQKTGIAGIDLKKLPSYLLFAPQN
jgi:hypothetical protein